MWKIVYKKEYLKRIITFLKYINYHAEAFVNFDFKGIARTHKNNEINPQNSVHPLRPKLLINKGAITVIKPPERSG